MRRLALILAAGLLLISAVPTFAATGNTIWRAKLTSTTLHGGATLERVANGSWASLAVKVYHVKPDTRVTVTLWDKSTGSSTSTQILGRETFKSSASGVATHWTKLTKTEYAALAAAVKAKDTLWVTVTATPTGASAVSVQLTGEFKTVR